MTRAEDLLSCHDIAVVSIVAQYIKSIGIGRFNSVKNINFGFDHNFFFDILKIGNWVTKHFCIKKTF